jgi:hypothetical protein
MSGIQATFKLKNDRIEKPETCLGAQLEQKMIGGVMCWIMSSEQNVKSGDSERRNGVKCERTAVAFQMYNTDAKQLQTGTGCDSGTKHPGPI